MTDCPAAYRDALVCTQPVEEHADPDIHVTDYGTRWKFKPDGKPTFRVWKEFPGEQDETVAAMVDRSMTIHEVDALVTVESVEKLMVKAYRLLDSTSETDRLEAQMLLYSAIDLTAARTATAVKSQRISEAISAAAKVKVEGIEEEAARMVAPLRGRS